MRVVKTFTSENEFKLADDINTFAKSNELQVMELSSHLVERADKKEFVAFVIFDDFVETS
jgi:hypothetical protein